MSIFAELPSECYDYQILNEATRNHKYRDVINISDNIDPGCKPHEQWKGPGWYRIMEPAGTKIPEFPPAPGCGTTYAGWMNGNHPDKKGESVEREICFHYAGNICSFKTTITVTNCKEYYVYNLLTHVNNYCTSRHCAE